MHAASASHLTNPTTRMNGFRWITTAMLAFTAACSGDSDSGKAGGTDGKERAESDAGTNGLAACSKSDTTPLSLAVRDYITRAMPSAQRFLSAMGTDSALPDDGFRVLQDKGPTYFYSSDTTAQRKIREKLAEVGPFGSLLVVYRGQTAAPDGQTVDVRLGGHYVGGQHDGKQLAGKRFSIRCDSTGWRIASSAEEPGA
ncbi:MAG TPA: hypothetical protein VE869_11665 [Gemmatimonas sp.]|nr:hypothetical protein [Gemmatimonas sp.]